MHVQTEITPPLNKELSALGHHLDDILETLLMNMIGKGQLATMAPRMQYKNYPLTVIRPLGYADIDSIIDHAEKSGFKSSICICTYQDNSGRKDARGKLDVLTDGDPLKKKADARRPQKHLS